MPKVSSAYTAGVLLLLQLSTGTINCENNRAWGAKEAKPVHATRQPVLGFFNIHAFPPVSNSAAPTFILYNDGTVIFRNETTSTQDENRFLTTTLSASEQAKLMSSLTPLSRAKDNYSISNHTCQPMNILSINTAKLKKRIKVYGSMLPPANPKSRDVRKTLPPLLVSTSDQLMHFKHTKAQPWSPEWVEVRLCAMPAAKDEAVAWPSDLPDLNDERTQKLSTDEYSVLVPISKYDQLKALTKEPTAKIAVVLLHGKKYRATYRMPFPEEKAIEALKFK